MNCVGVLVRKVPDGFHESLRLIWAQARAPDLHLNIHQLVTSSSNSTQNFYTSWPYFLAGPDSDIQDEESDVRNIKDYPCPVSCVFIPRCVVAKIWERYPNQNGQ